MDSPGRVTQWAASVAGGVTPTSPAHFHFRKSDDIRVVAEALHQLVGWLAAQDLPITLRLVVPLSDAESLVTSRPSEEEASAFDAFEPPSLYLLHQDAFRSRNDNEEYRVPMDFPALTLGDSRLAAKYRCFRNAEHLAFDDPEFARDVIVDFYRDP